MKKPTYEESVEVELKAEEIGAAKMDILLNSLSGGRWVDIVFGSRLGGMFQKHAGDRFANDRKGAFLSIEYKTEKQNAHQNFFFEKWSNKKTKRPGWMYPEEHRALFQGDVLWYFFLLEGFMYSMDFQRLRGWFFKRGHYKRFPLKEQYKYAQHNTAEGWCIPIEYVCREFGTHQRNWTMSGWVSVNRDERHELPF